MARGTLAPALRVPHILNETQRSVAVHKKCAKLLWDVERQGSAACFEELRVCLQHVLLIAKV